MENFLKQFSSLPKKFITDFFIIAKEEYTENELVIDFDVVCEWLNTRKDHLKKILLKYFEDRFDYSLERKKKETNK